MNPPLAQVFHAAQNAPTIPTEMLEELFDHVPETVFFAKDLMGRYIAVNRSLLERCGLKEKRELIGRHVRDVFPKQLAERYAAQDSFVISTGRAIRDNLELHWYAGRRPDWCLTTKLPLREESGAITGLIGISRDIRSPRDRSDIPPALAGALEYLHEHFDEEISAGKLAKLAGVSAIRFARLIRRIFRLTPSQLVTQTRLAAASEMLMESDRSIVEIANACGFSDHSAFTRAFRAATGVTPSQYRQHW